METSDRLPLYLEPVQPCPYVSGKISQNAFLQVPMAEALLLDALLEDGFRHFGDLFFQPFCPGCRKCRGLVVDPDEFRPSRSQRRNEKANAELLQDIAAPIVDGERLALLARYQDWRTTHKGWPVQSFDADSYCKSFAWSPDLSRELTLRTADGQLVGVLLFDLTGSSANAIYHYHDPLLKSRGLGTNLILRFLQYVHSRGCHKAYLGLWNPESASLSYKASFGPHRLLPEWDSPHG